MKAPTVITLRPHLLLVFILISGVLLYRSSSADYPQPLDNYVNDFAGVISEDDRAKLMEDLKKLEDRTKIEITVVTINSISDFGTGESTIEDFARNLFDKWGVGNLPRNNGAMILVAVKDRKMRIELGKGWAHRKDRLMQRIVDNFMVPEFKLGNYSAGIVIGTEQVKKALTSPILYSLISWIVDYWVVILIALIIPYSLFQSYLRKRRADEFYYEHGYYPYWYTEPSSGNGGWLGGGGGGGFGGGGGGGGGASGSW